jgi:TonB-dependent SusC/RagA subfamily outer membrane receptor
MSSCVSSYWAGKRKVVRGVVGAAVFVGLVNPAAARTQNLLAAESPLTMMKSAKAERQDSLLGRVLSLDLRQVTLEDAILEIGKRGKTTIVYDRKLIPTNKRVSLRNSSISVAEALEQVLQGTNVTISVSPNGMIHLVEKKGAQPQSTGTVQGRITDSATQKGISGATVSITGGGTKLSVSSGEDGTYRILNVPSGEHTLSIRFLGYKTYTRTVVVEQGKAVTVNAVLSPAASVLSGVVTTATGKQRRMEIGNDITTLKVDSIQQVAPVSTVTDLLEARVPGVQVMRTSGQPGAPRRIRLRGTSSINGSNDPIVIVDGIRIFAEQSDSLFGSRSVASGRVADYATPSPLDQIDINSIETIEVFKGPSATSMYGADAANGVIVITTKRGRVGRPTWTISTNRSLEYIPGKYPNVVRAFGNYEWGPIPTTPDKRLCLNSDLHCLIDSVVVFQALNESNLTVLGRGHGTDLSVGVQGGVSNITYSFTGSGSRQLGLFRLPGLEVERYRTLTGTNAPGWMRRPDRYQTWGGTGTLGIELGRSTRATITSSLFSSDQQQSSLGSNAISQLVNKYVDTMTLATEPLIEKFYERGTSASLTSNTAIRVASNRFSWFPVSATVGLSVVSRTDKTFVPRGAAVGTPDSVGSFSMGRGSSTIATIAVAADQIPIGRFFTMSMGADAQSRNAATLTSFINSIPIGISEPQNLGCPGESSLACGSRQNTLEESTFGWFIEPKLNMNSRFFVVPGIRLDGGSASGSNTRFTGLKGLTGFPKLNFSWIALDRSDQPLWGAVTMLRPRIAMGMAGVQPRPTDKLRIFSDDTLSFEGNATYGAYVQWIGNTQLRPERSREIEGGFDLELWHNRLSVQLSQYRKDRHDAIIDIPVAQSVLGGRNQKVNIGRIRNIGTELQLSTTLLESSQLSWTVSGSLSKNSNKLISLAPGMESITAGEFTSGPEAMFTRIVPGYPLFSNWGRPILAYHDRNGNGRLDESEILVGDSLVYLGGSSEPNFTSSLNSHLSWRRVSFHATLHYTNGLSQININGTGIVPGLYDPSAPLGVQAASIALSCNNISPCMSTPYGVVQTVNMLRFNSVSINYAIPKSVVQKIGGQSLSIALQGANLGLWTNYRGKDPNVNAFATGNLVADTGQLPQPRKWSLHVSLTY